MLLAEFGTTYYVVLGVLLIGVIILWRVLKARGVN